MIPAAAPRLVPPGSTPRDAGPSTHPGLGLAVCWAQLLTWPGVEVWLRALRQRPGSPRVAVAHREGGSRRSGVTAIPAESGVPVSRADGRVGTDELVHEIVQQVLRGPVQMLGVAVPGVTVGLAAVPPEPLPDDAEAIDRDIGRTGGGIDHRGEHLSKALRRAGSGCRQQARGQYRCRPGRRQAVLRRGARTRIGWDRAPGRYPSGCPAPPSAAGWASPRRVRRGG